MTTAVAADRHNLQAKSLKELAELYNKLVPEKPIGKFKDKPTAVRRVEVALEAKGVMTKDERKEALAEVKEVIAEQRAAASEKKVKKDKSAAVTEERAKTERKRSGGRKRNLFSVSAKTRIKPHRENTRRAEAVKMLTKGATLEELMAETRWNYRQAKEAVWLLHKHLGYGLTENPSNGKIHVTLPPSKS